MVATDEYGADVAPQPITTRNPLDQSKHASTRKQHGYLISK